jgi:hypothetical protein
MTVSGQLYPQGKSPCYPLDRRLGGPQLQSGCGGEKILKACSSLINHPLNYMHNRSLYTATFPGYCKFSVVIPLHKKGDKTNMANSRPVFLLTVFPKVLEESMHSRLDIVIILTELQICFITFLPTSECTSGSHFTVISCRQELATSQAYRCLYTGQFIQLVCNLIN